MLTAATAVAVEVTNSVAGEVVAAEATPCSTVTQTRAPIHTTVQAAHISNLIRINDHHLNLNKGTPGTIRATGLHQIMGVRIITIRIPEEALRTHNMVLMVLGEVVMAQMTEDLVEITVDTVAREELELDEAVTEATEAMEDNLTGVMEIHPLVVEGVEVDINCLSVPPGRHIP